MRQADQRCYLTKKLHNDDGATLFIALLFFIICATCGAVLLVAGTQAAGRIAGLTKNEQNLYAATSAAKMLKDEINNRTVTIEESNVSDASPASDVSSLLKDLVSSELGQKKDVEKETTVTVSNMPDTKVKFTIYSDYHILAECIAGSGDDMVTAYAHLPAGVQTIPATNENEHDKTQITYSGGYVSSQAEEQ